MISIAKSLAAYIATMTSIDLSTHPFGNGEARVISKPSDYAAGGVKVTHPELDLSELLIPLVTVTVDDEGDEPAAIGAGEISATFPAAVGVHCMTESQLELHGRWTRHILELAWSTAPEGAPWPGIPLIGELYELQFDGAYWVSDQPNWYASPAPIVYRNGAIVVGPTIDLVHGKVTIAGSVATDRVQATFTAGIWSFTTKAVGRPDIETPAKLQHRHNFYFLLEGEAFVRAPGHGIV